jgi:hypothetical protein
MALSNSMTAAVTGAMTGGGNRKAAPMSQTQSDGLSALTARLSGAKKNKPMKSPMKPKKMKGM